jgi:hypothetical protein
MPSTTRRREDEICGWFKLRGTQPSGRKPPCACRCLAFRYYSRFLDRMQLKATYMATVSLCFAFRRKLRSSTSPGLPEQQLEVPAAHIGRQRVSSGDRVIELELFSDFMGRGLTANGATLAFTAGGYKMSHRKMPFGLSILRGAAPLRAGMPNHMTWRRLQRGVPSVAGSGFALSPLCLNEFRREVSRYAFLPHGP